LYVKNSTDRRIGFHLRIPDTFISMQVSLSPGDKFLDRDQGIELRALEPGEGERERERERERLAGRQAREREGGPL